jgi:hypothetical protein
MTIYGLTRWCQLPPDMDQLRYRRAISALSARPIGVQRLCERTGLTKAEARALLDCLRREGALFELPSDATGKKRGGLLLRLCRWVLGAHSPSVR